MIKELFPGLDENELLELWPTYEVDEKKVEKLTTTNISHANIALNSILDDLEKVQLEKLFFADNGWYKIINQDGMVQLKLAAMSLGLSNNVFTFDSAEEQHMLEVVIMAIKYADTIINEIKERGPIITSETSVNGEEFEKWIYGEETANVAPVLLPAMNINEYFRKKYEKNGQ